MAYNPDTWYELMRSCPATPIAADGTVMNETTNLTPGQELQVRDQRDGNLVVVARGSAQGQEWQYLVRPVEFERALTQPGDLPRSGDAPTAPATTAGSPD